MLVGSKSFHSREEVVAIRTALRAIEWPDDELSVFATVRGSLFAVQDGTLLKFREQHGTLHPFKDCPVLGPEFEPIKDALDLLAATAPRAQLRSHRRHHQPPAGDAVLTQACFSKGGERVLANVLRLADLSRQFEGHRLPISFVH